MSSQEVRLKTITPARTTSLAAEAKEDAHVLMAVHQLYAIPMAIIAPISLTTTLISSTATLKIAYHNTCNLIHLCSHFTPPESESTHATRMKHIGISVLSGRMR